LIVAVCALTLGAGLSAAHGNGMTQEMALSEGANLNAGATCHAPLPNDNVRAVLQGVPGNYSAMPSPGEAYMARQFNLTVRISGGPGGDIGGFNLRVSAGTLEPASGQSALMRIESQGAEATHTVAGNKQREWDLVWTAPEEPADAVVFDLVVNAIFPPDERDPASAAPTSQWNRATFVSSGEHGPNVGAGAGHGLRIEEIGVNWLAYWVGIVSFVFLGVVLVAYYIVFRFGETAKATDHRDRKAKK
jgi:hypothetical protein